jgi:MFS transporter
MTEPVPLRKNAPFQMLWLGGVASELGSQFTRLVMPLLVLGLTDSPAWAGTLAGAGLAGSVLALVPAGVWVDRWDRRRTLFVNQSVQLLASAGMATVVIFDMTQIWLLALLSVVGGACTSFIGILRRTAIRGLVPDSQLRNAYMQEESRSHAARLAGPPIGGVLYGLGQGIPFAAEAITLLVAQVASTAAKVPRRPRTERKHCDGTEGSESPLVPPRHRSSMRREAGEALRWLWHQYGLREICGVITVLNLLGGAFMIPLIVLIAERGGGAEVTGVVLAAAGIGGLLGALTSNRIARVLPVGSLLLAIVGVFGASLTMMALPLGPWWPMAPLLIISLSTPSINVVMDAVVAQLVPESMLGRMDASLGFVARSLAPMGPVLGWRACIITGRGRSTHSARRCASWCRGCGKHQAQSARVR